MIDPIQQQIDRTLAALNAVEPSRNLHARLLDTLEGHEAPRPKLAPRWLALPLAALLALAVALTLHPTAKLPNAKLATEQTPHSKFPNSRLGPEQNPNSKLPNSKLATQPTPQTAQLAHRDIPPGAPPSPTVSSSAKVGPPPPIHLEATLTANPVMAEDQAFADFHAPSQLAPRMPPTAQERLVLLMLRRGERHDLAQLDRAQQAAFAEEEQNARRAFFDPPSPIPPQPEYNAPGAPK